MKYTFISCAFGIVDVNIFINTVDQTLKCLTLIKILDIQFWEGKVLSKQGLIYTLILFLICLFYIS
jgi:hypothetical protein